MTEKRGGSRLSLSLLGLSALVVVLYVLGRVSVAPAVDGEALVQTITYGDAPSAFGRLHVPAGGGEDRSVVVLLHGGFWRRQGGDLSLMEPLAEDLVGRGHVVWNVEYGRTGERFGGWPHTFNHVAAAIDHLAVLATDVPMDLSSVTVVGHSAGGHLALWLSGRDGFEARSAWDREIASASPVVVPAQVVALAPIADLVAAADAGSGNGAVATLLGGTPSEVPLRYAVATPAPSAGVDTLIVVGSEDDTVLPEFSVPPWTGFEWVEVPGEDHLRLISPESEAWQVVIDWVWE